MASIAPYSAARLHSDLLISSSIYHAVQRVEAMLASANDTVGVWQKRIEARRALASLSDDMLSDIGLDRLQVMAEVKKPFWRA